MQTLIPEATTQFYRENGFVILPDLLGAEEVAQWRKVIFGAVAERSGRMPATAGGYGESFKPGGRLESDQYYNKVFTQKINLWMSDLEVRELVLNERLGQVAAELSGVDGVRIYLDQALVKEAWGNPTAFHIDNPFWSFTSPHAVTIWIALTDSTVENGCLCYIPGSQKLEKYTNAQIAPELGALFDVYPELRDIDPVFCPVPAGSAVAHNGLTAHGAGANMTRHRRFAMTIAYMPDGATYNGKQDIMTNEQASRLSVGDRLDDPTQNPLVFIHAPADRAR